MAVPNRWRFPDLGLGLGLRPVHYGPILEQRPPVDFFEIISENFMGTEGRPLFILDQIAERYPIVMHGVSMSIGTTDAIDLDYFKRLKALAKRVNAVWLGDHVCWTGIGGKNGHDLLPVPYDEESLDHLIARVKEIQDVLERPLVLENPSTYVTFTRSTLPEEKFIRTLAEEADCGLLLDVNNVYVTCRNHGLDPFAYLDGVPYDRVVQIHIAGHTDKGTHCIDTHSKPLIETVWRLYAEAERRTGGRATLLEWDEDIPSFEATFAELKKAKPFKQAARRKVA